MRKYVYENATVYITVPSEEQIENIRKATERFAKQLAKEGLLENEQRQNNYRTSRNGSYARKRNTKTKKKDTAN